MNFKSSKRSSSSESLTSATVSVPGRLKSSTARGGITRTTSRSTSFSREVDGKQTNAQIESKSKATDLKQSRMMDEQKTRLKKVEGRIQTARQSRKSRSEANLMIRKLRSLSLMICWSSADHYNSDQARRNQP